MAERWHDDALAEAEESALADAAVALMNQYGSATPEARPEIMVRLRAVLEGDLDAAGLAESDDLGSASIGGADPGTESDDGDQAGDQDDDGAFDEAFDEDGGYPPPEPTHIARQRVRRAASHTFSPQNLQSSPTILPGIGPATAEQLARLGIHQVVDILWHLPARHEDYSQLRTISQLQPGEKATIIANLWEVRERKVGINRSMVQGILADGTGTLHATWWNRFIIKQLTPGSTMRWSGKVGLYMGQKTLDNPVFEDVDDERVATGRLAPIYPLTEGLGQKRLREIIKLVLDEFAAMLADPLPKSILDQYELMALGEALQQVHFPDDSEQLAAALRRLTFEELFYVQLGVLQRRADLTQATAQPLPSDRAMIERFAASLPFALTGAQMRVLDEIAADIAREVPMTRLIQGDVGSGKTAVAAGVMAIAATNRAQSALLAPTQILAEQHFRGITTLLASQSRPDATPIRVELLTGRVTGDERTRVLTGLANGQIDVVVGTTALIQEAVEFANLGFVVVDEQHRFGVEQRGALRNKGAQPHLLVMSATPIPRSLALTVYGDLDISVIDEMPPGRIPVKTKWFRPAERERLYNFMRREASEGRQGFIVYPLVEESENLTAGAAVEEYTRLSEEVFPALNVALL
ncbi:MAG: ATP-dependent DNA helicase RecG, partial [Caldilineaceae bacterium]|nr:ATP-dependent DNA helicase RecG [Caldilineaceae bacterium]